MSIAPNEDLQHLNSCLDPAISKHDRVILLIGECIRLGIDLGPVILLEIGRLGFDRKHVGKLLHDLAGPDPKRHHWHRDTDRRYRVHDADMTT
ncbi:hypothetical protein [Novosphingobium album (ex Hu et al. 2023)]|uniref:Uncharacterized protein n=1 Tax=Novosphingobium album (ex Hu et al. 2023) TaxID=2930093 RepID=A0ABT0B0R4_9SPHN|nr:hypothetical protein [Novosphingobium album (ex Hu et al. 2023)]MCJ2178600.1 hypothetical protein [Novosphingobium album (ex Hu et al. 2023)]